MVSNEGIYLLYTREMITTNENIYKLGRSNYLDNRVKQYPNGSKILLMINCINSISCEYNLIKLFKEKFIQKTYYGKEYFQGNCLLMIKEICNYINNQVKANVRKVKVVAQQVDAVAQQVEAVVHQVDAVVNTKKDDKKVDKKKSDRTCPKCKQYFCYPSLLKRHLQFSSRCSMTNEELTNIYNSNNKNVIKCSCCNREFSRKDSLNRHLKSLQCSK
jgi:hypothetical protein